MFVYLKCCILIKENSKGVLHLSNKKIQPLKNLNSNKSKDIEGLDLSGGYICDVETGICGPADEVNDSTEDAKEKKHEDNDLV